MFKYCLRITFLLLVTNFFSLLIKAQESGLNYSVTHVSDDSSSNSLLLGAKNYLEKELNDRGGIYNEEEGYLFLIGISKPTEKDEVALSVTVFTKIEKEIVELGKKEQIFYSLLGNEKRTNIPTESIAIREYVSEEYMRQFSMILDNYLVVTSIDNLDSSVHRFIKTFFEEYIDH